MKKIIVSLLFIMPLWAWGQVNDTIPEETAEAEIFEIFESMPYYPGYDSAIEVFIAKNLIYPPQALKDSIQGRVYVQFTVEANGELNDIKVYKSLSTECDQEAIRVVKMMPKWIPGSSNGKPARSRIVIPIKFKIK